MGHDFNHSHLPVDLIAKVAQVSPPAPLVYLPRSPPSSLSIFQLPIYNISCGKSRFGEGAQMMGIVGVGWVQDSSPARGCRGGTVSSPMGVWCGRAMDPQKLCNFIILKS